MDLLRGSQPVHRPPGPDGKHHGKLACRIFNCLWNKRIERSGGPFGEIMTVSVPKTLPDTTLLYDVKEKVIELDLVFVIFS